jgi:small subunit ribosomal protein S1
MSTEQNHNNNSNEESFAEMFEHSVSRRDDFIVGSRVEGTIVYISGGNAFVDIQGKSEAVIDINEFRNADGVATVSVGDTIGAYVASLSAGEIHLTTGVGMGPVSPAVMEMAFRESIPVYGVVQEVVKGGYSISVGGIRCFCPFSHIDSRPPADRDELTGKSLTFKIIEYRERGKNIILSRSVLLEEKRKRAEDSLKKTLKQGDAVSGTVTGVRPFGVFVDIEGFDALIPKSELSRSRFSDTGQFRYGETVKAAVKSIDWDAKKITLSIKDLLPDPWEDIDKYEVGQTINGRVVNIIKNGAFVEIEPGMDGFIPVSRMSYVKKINKPEEAVAQGSWITATITGINRGERKISLELVSDEDDPWKEQGNLTGQVGMVSVESHTPSGLRVRLQNGMSGFIPRSELKARTDAEIQRRYTPGMQIQAAVLSIIRENRKLVLSEARAQEMEDSKDFENFIKKESPSQTATLGDMLVGKFKDIREKMDK